jgi:hypothetical protein
MARDLYHQAVRTALEKEGWKITADPYKIPYKGTEYEVDLAAESVLAAERGEQKIAVEIKSFLRDSVSNEFHGALGQFLNYQFIMQKTEPNRHLYLAVRQAVFETFFQLPFTLEVIEHYNVSLLVFQPNTEEVILWKNSSSTAL